MKKSGLAYSPSEPVWRTCLGRLYAELFEFGRNIFSVLRFAQGGPLVHLLARRLR